MVHNVPSRYTARFGTASSGKWGYLDFTPEVSVLRATTTLQDQNSCDDPDGLHSTVHLQMTQRRGYGNLVEFIIGHTSILGPCIPFRGDTNWGDVKGETDARSDEHRDVGGFLAPDDGPLEVGLRPITGCDSMISAEVLMLNTRRAELSAPNRFGRS